ncbi:hypothetical protein [Rothia mucilaginosa]|uniref:hypothetical protein n=1 Tax=Rothia mucilaginosa TaxID=43675 RepID=UPI0028DD0D32|nr:hypothetical protein [Rothia mucilaginosa]
MKFANADFENPETRRMLFEYFVDKIYLYEDRLVFISWYSEDNREVPYEALKGDDDPFAEEEAIEFDCFPFESTISQPSAIPYGVRR